MSDIKIKHYLNKKLKSKKINGEIKYSVYFRFNLEGKNHRIPSFFIMDYIGTEKELNSYVAEMEEEEYFINLFNKRSNNYIFKDYQFDIQFIAMSVKDILQNFMKTGDGKDLHPDYYYSLSSYMENYKKDFIEFISKSHNYSIDFTESFFKLCPSEEHDFYPVDFIKDSKIKCFYEAYNHVMKFSKNRLIHEYDWIERKQGEVFKELYGEKYFDIINEIVIDRRKSNNLHLERE